RNLDAALEREVPDWQAINRDPRWFEWLAGVHEFSGYTRQQLLNDAVNKGDAHRVISIFRGFLREQGVAEHGASPERSPRRRPTTNKPVYTRAEITGRAALRRRGAINDADWARWENELIAAGREGRIVGALDLRGR